MIMYAVNCSNCGKEGYKKILSPAGLNYNRLVLLSQNLSTIYFKPQSEIGYCLPCIHAIEGILDQEE